MGTRARAPVKTRTLSSSTCIFVFYIVLIESDDLFDSLLKIGQI